MALSHVCINVPISKLNQYKDKGISIPEFVELKPIVHDVRELKIYKLSDKLFAIQTKEHSEPVFVGVERHVNLCSDGEYPTFEYADILPILKLIGMAPEEKDE